MELLDINGNPLNIGDVVVFTFLNKPGLYTGTIVRIDGKSVEVIEKNGAKLHAPRTRSFCRIAPPKVEERKENKEDSVKDCYGAPLTVGQRVYFVSFEGSTARGTIQGIKDEEIYLTDTDIGTDHPIRESREVFTKESYERVIRNALKNALTCAKKDEEE